MDAQEQFYNEFLTSMSAVTDGNITTDIISESLTKLLSKYQVTLKSTELTTYESLPQCVIDYIGVRKIEGVAVSSLKLYGYKLKHFFSSIRTPVETISVNDIRRYLWELKEETNCSDRTLDGTRSIISTFFGWANAEGYIPSNPCKALKPIKYTCKERGHLTEMEVEKLRLVATDKRDKAILEMFLSTGCRVSELTNLKKSDIDLETGKVRLFGKGSKYRTSYLNAKATLALKDYLESRPSDEEAIFINGKKPYNALSQKSIDNMISALGKQAGFTKKIYPHLLRHTTATLGLQKGMPVQEVQKLLGHANIATTMIYADVADDSVQISHKKFIS